MKQTLGKRERLKSNTLISRLYEEGKPVKSFPLRLVYLQTTHTSDFPAQVGFSVPKRNFKKAVSRNRLKRLLRETYRKNKHLVYNSVEVPYVYMISYIGKEKSSYAEVEKSMITLLNNFLNQIKSEKNE